MTTSKTVEPPPAGRRVEPLVRPSLVYLATPYSDPDPLIRRERFEKVNDFAARMMRSGLHVFSPISHTHPIAQAGGLQLGWEFWEACDLKILSVCEKLIVLKLDGWQNSRGVTAEIAIANELGLSVEFVDFS